MSGQSDQRPSEAEATPVPDLIERYRMRRDAWIAQADELARLRDEVRGSAEREAMEIVTAARRDVRQVIMEARRELLVLSAQVQAALGEATAKTDSTTLLHKAGLAAGDQSKRPSLTSAPPDPGFAPEAAVDEIINEVHADMTALAEDARALPLQAVPPIRNTLAPSAPPVPTVAPTVAARSPEPPAPAPPAAVSEPQVSNDFSTYESPALSEAASRALLSSPFSSESVPVPAGRSFRTFVAAFAVIGVLVAGATIWWLSRGVDETPRSAAADTKTSQPAIPTPESSVQTEAAEPAGAGTAAASPATEFPERTTTKSAHLSVVAEAVRDVWVRTTVDGRTDQGRTLAAGQAIDIAADQSISLRVGDAGAVVVSVNRGEKRPLGRDGEVVTRQFVVEGGGAPDRSAPRPVAPRNEAPTSAPPLLPPTVSATPGQVPPFPVPVAAAAPAPSPSAATIPPVNQVTAAAPPLAKAESPAIPPVAGNSTGTISPATAVVAAARQWLDAYHRQDRASMAALSTDNLLLSDERRPDERLPSGLGDVKRTLDRVSVQIAADTAVLTAVMTEQADSSPTPRVSPVSQVWVLAGNGQWKVRQARIVSEARLNQVFR